MGFIDRQCFKPLAALAFVLLLGSTAHAADMSRVDFSALSSADTRLGRSLLTGWGVPLSQGPVSIVLVAPQSTMSDAYQLSYRLDVELNPVAMVESHGPEHARLLDRMGALLGDASVLVLANLNAYALDEETTSQIERRVQRGLGLVVIEFAHEGFRWLPHGGADTERLDASTPLLRGIGHSLVPDWPEDDNFIYGYGHGAGRVVRIRYPGPRPQTQCLVPVPPFIRSSLPEYRDDYFSLVARAILWAAQREPALQITSVVALQASGPIEDEVPPNLPRKFVQRMRDAVVTPVVQSFRLSLSGPAAKEYDVAAQLRYPGRETRWYSPLESRIKEGRDSYLLELPTGLGEMFLDIWIRDKKGVVDWFTHAMQVAGWPEMSDLSFSKAVLRRNDSLNVSLSVRPHLHQPRRCLLYVRARDPSGRVVAEQYTSISSQGGRVSSVLDFVDLTARSLVIDVYVVDRPSEPIDRWDIEHAAHIWTTVAIETDERPAFRFVADGDASLEFAARQMNQTLKRMGMDSVHVQGNERPNFGATTEGLGVISHVMREELSLHTWSQALRSAGPRLSSMSNDPLVDTVAYSLGEVFADAGATSETVMSEWTAELEGAYASVTELNEAWGARFDSMDEAAKAPALGDDGSLAAWLSYQAFSDRLLVQQCAHARRAMRKVSPGAHVGFCAAGPAAQWRSADWAGLLSELDLAVFPIEALLVDKIRGAMASDGLSLARVDLGAVTPVRARWAPWYALLHDLSGIQVEGSYGTLGSPLAMPAIAPARPVAPVLADIATQIGAMSRGFSALIRASARLNSGVAVYDSRTSTVFAQAVDAFECRVPEAQSAFTTLLKELGYQYDFVSTRHALDGGLDAYDVVILPMVRAMSDEEILALATFSDNGGSLIADVSPGQYNQLGRRRHAAFLKEKFGALHVHASRVEQKVPLIRLTEKGEKAVIMAMPPVTVDSSIRAQGSTPLASGGEAPIWLVRAQDSGVNVLLNHALPAMRDFPHFQDTFASWLLRAGAEVAAPIALTKGPPFEGDIVTYRYGASRVTAFLRDPEAPDRRRKYRYAFTGDGYVYDMLSGEALGKNPALTLTLEAGELALFSCVPYEVTRVVLEAPRRITAGRRFRVSVAVRSRETLPQRHMVHISLVRRGAEFDERYDRDIECLEGIGETYLALDHNAKPGIYDLVARDVLTGVRTETTLAVYSRPTRLAR